MFDLAYIVQTCKICTLAPSMRVCDCCAFRAGLEWRDLAGEVATCLPEPSDPSYTDLVHLAYMEAPEPQTAAEAHAAMLMECPWMDDILAEDEFSALKGTNWRKPGHPENENWLHPAKSDIGKYKKQTPYWNGDL